VAPIFILGKKTKAETINKKSHRNIGVPGIPMYETHRPPNMDSIRVNIRI
jgi:hypothetical protein